MATAELEHPATLESVVDNPDPLFEIIDGQRVDLPPMGTLATFVASELHITLGYFTRTQGLGRTVIEAMFELAINGGRNRRPDLAFVSYQRWPQTELVPEEGNAWPIVPDVCIEVVSPFDLVEDLLEKIDEYFRAGSRQVWVVFPKRRVVYVYDAVTQIRVLTRADTLDGGAVIPGFSLPLASLFPEPAA
jgi:Uma2 family endonuclease